MPKFKKSDEDSRTYIRPVITIWDKPGGEGEGYGTLRKEHYCTKNKGKTKDDGFNNLRFLPVLLCHVFMFPPTVSSQGSTAILESDLNVPRERVRERESSRETSEQMHIKKMDFFVQLRGREDIGDVCLFWSPYTLYDTHRCCTISRSYWYGCVGGGIVRRSHYIR